jgi:hypothetical protein
MLKYCSFDFKHHSLAHFNRIDGVMVKCAFTSSAVDCGFESRSGQTKDYEIGISCFSVKHAVLIRKQRLVGKESG